MEIQLIVLQIKIKFQCKISSHSSQSNGIGFLQAPGGPYLSLSLYLAIAPSDIQKSQGALARIGDRRPSSFSV